MIAIQILAAWFLVACLTASIYSAVRTIQKRRAIAEYNLNRAEYELLAARYLKCIEVAYSVERRRII